MTASYKIECGHICSIPNKVLFQTLIQSPSISSDLVIILISFMSKCYLRISMHLLVAQ